MRRVLLAVLAANIVVGGAGTAGAATTAASIVDNQYQPSRVVVAPGDTVTWTDNGSSSHSVTSDSGAFDSNPACGSGGSCLSRGLTFSFTFTQPGTFAYHCRIHGAAGGVGMSGVVVVGQNGAQKPVKRLSGEDRILTSVAVSRDAFSADGSAKAAVLARAAAFSDALAGTPLAVAKGGPLLLVADSEVLPPAVQSEIQRVLPKASNVYLLGGELAIRPGIASQLAQLGYTPVRYSGPDRYATAVAVAHQGLGDPGTIVLATGATFADALAGGSHAAKAGGPLLLTAPSDLPAAVVSYLRSNRSIVASAAVYGGTGAVSDNVVVQVQSAIS